MKNQFGQGTILYVLIIGLVLAMLVYFGIGKLAYFHKETARLSNTQIAQSVLSSTALKVQQIYANESSCDPKVLDSRLSRLPNVTAADATARGVALAIANPAGGSSNERNNLCSGGSEGCRQFLMDLESLGYLVTVGQVGASDDGGVTTECPRDATVRLSVTIAGTVYYRRVTLINTCTYTSCGSFGESFDGVTANAGDDNLHATPCDIIPERPFGSIVQADAETKVTVDDLRWARRYLSTGGGDVGDTTYMNTGGTDLTAGTNGSCTKDTLTPVLCRSRNCIPAFDLNLDRANSEADLSILEYYLRGYIPVLPVRDFLE